MGGVGVTVVTAACLAAWSTSRPAVLVAEPIPSYRGASDNGDSVSGGGGEVVFDENFALVAAAHALRRTLAPPHQSFFRVVCILVYEDFAGRLHRITGEYVFAYSTEAVI